MALNEQHEESKQITPPIKLLIADDDTPTRLLLRAAVSQWGYEVVEAHNGEEAWEILQLPDAPLLLILDWLMPKLEGVDLCKRIRNNLATSHNSFVPYIILLTQMTGTENIIKGLEAGANEFLSKPFNMAELRSRLSIGKQIVQYEQKTEELHAQLQEITNIAISSSQHLSDLSKNIEKTKVNDQFKKIITICKHLTFEPNKKG